MFTLDALNQEEQFFCGILIRGFFITLQAESELARSLLVYQPIQKPN